MHHHTGIDVCVCPGVNNGDLSAEAFFCGCTHEAHTTGDFLSLQKLSHPEKSSGGHHGDEIVPTGVADSWKGIIFRIVGHNSASLSVLGDKGCLKTIGVPGYLKAQFFKHRRNVIMSHVLLVTKFGIAVDLKE
jgi:hypothetical protein